MNATYVLPRQEFLFSAIYHQHEDRLLGYLSNRGLRKQDAEDVAQEVWMRIWRNIHRFDGSDFVAWMLKIARNCVVDLVRHMRKDQTRLRRFAAELLAENPAMQTGSFSPASHEIVEHLEVSLNRKCVFIETVKAQLSGECVEETAQRLGVSVNTVYTRRNRGRKRLKVILENTTR